MNTEKIKKILAAVAEDKKIQRRKLTTTVGDTDFNEAEITPWQDVENITELDFSIHYGSKETGGNVFEMYRYDYRVKPNSPCDYMDNERETIEQADAAVKGATDDPSELRRLLKEVTYFYRTYRGHVINIMPLYEYNKSQIVRYKRRLGIPVQEDEEE